MAKSGAAGFEITSGIEAFGCPAGLPITLSAGSNVSAVLAGDLPSVVRVIGLFKYQFVTRVRGGVAGAAGSGGFGGRFVISYLTRVVETPVPVAGIPDVGVVRWPTNTNSPEVSIRSESGIAVIVAAPSVTARGRCR